MVGSSNARSTFSLSSLLCLETQTCLNNDDDDEENDDHEEINEYTSDLGGGADDDEEEEEEYLKILFVREIRHVELESRQYSSISDWIKRARLDSIQWILNTRALLGFRLQTAYLSVNYFDQFISRRFIDREKHWAIRLLSVACLSLAAKMEECKVPTLSEFPVEEYKFESKVIQRMELLVLNTLEWRMVWITPFDYLHYFVSKLCQQCLQRRNVVCRIIEIIFAITKDRNLVGHRSSSIAVAATLVAMDQQQLTRQSLEIKINAIPLSSFIGFEDVYSCYSGMVEKVKLSNFVTSTPDMSPGRTDVFENFGVTSAVGSKRKRLTFSDCGLPEEK